MNYKEFIKNKRINSKPTGIPKSQILSFNKMSKDFQADITRWSLIRGRSAIFADCGLGKTLMQLDWSNQVSRYTKANILILAPLSVSEQTSTIESDKFNIPVNICASQGDVKKGINITNYEKLDKFDMSHFSGIVLDESSILKNYSGAIRNNIINSCKRVPFKLACTATPAPNDFMELGNHSEFLGEMTRSQMLSMFFIHDGGDTAKWRLKGHANVDFWEWVCSWAVMIKKPSDLGYSDDGYILPELNIEQITVETEKTGDFLFQMEAKTLQERLRARRDTVEDRVKKASEIINTKPDEQWLIWCGLNDEASTISKISKCINVQGSDKEHVKTKNLLGFSNGEVQRLVTKPKIAGMGMNWQNCHNVLYLGLNDSYEQLYQTMRRCWRFGQKEKVNVYMVTADIEGNVVKNIERKEKDSELLANKMLKNMKDINSKDIHGMKNESKNYATTIEKDKNYELFNGDCVEYYKSMDNDSIDYTIFSPPFSSLYTYSDSERDMGNSKNDDEFIQHFGFLVNELLRVTKPGRCVSFHCMNIPAMKERDGYIGVKNFRGQLISLFEKAGFIFHSEHVIWKDPLLEAVRTKALGLMHKQLCKDSTKSRSGLPDYLITMKKRGENKSPVMHENGLSDYIGDNAPQGGVISHEIWRKYASPVWMDIRQSRTLQYKSARTDKDERHICPLQLDVIERGITLYSNVGDIVSSPFMGICSEGYSALKMKRKFKGSELKKSYFNIAVNNAKDADVSMTENDLFGGE